MNAGTGAAAGLFIIEIGSPTSEFCGFVIDSGRPNRLFGSYVCSPPFIRLWEDDVDNGMPLWITCASVELLTFVLLWEEEIEFVWSDGIVSSNDDSLLIVADEFVVDAMEVTCRPSKISDLGSFLVPVISGAFLVPVIPGALLVDNI